MCRPWSSRRRSTRHSWYIRGYAAADVSGEDRASEGKERAQVLGYETRDPVTTAAFTFSLHLKLGSSRIPSGGGRWCLTLLPAHPLASQCKRPQNSVSSSPIHSSPASYAIVRPESRTNPPCQAIRKKWPTRNGHRCWSPCNRGLGFFRHFSDTVMNWTGGSAPVSRPCSLFP